MGGRRGAVTLLCVAPTLSASACAAWRIHGAVARALGAGVGGGREEVKGGGGGHGGDFPAQRLSLLHLLIHAPT